MVTFWKGDTNYWPPGLPGTDETDAMKGLDFNTVGWVENGDTILRILFQWQLWSALYENSLITNDIPVPWVMAVWYEPNPDQFFEADTVNAWQALENDALYQSITEWQPYHWTDGTLHSTQWHASSGGVQSLKGERTILDSSSAHLRVQTLSLGGIGLETSGNIDVTVGGWYNLKMLIQR